MNMFSIHIYNRSESNFKVKTQKTPSNTNAALCLPVNPRAKVEWKPEAWTRLSGREPNPPPSDTNTHRLSPNDEKTRKTHRVDTIRLGMKLC